MDAEDDAYGKAMLDYHEHGEGFEIVERDDGFAAPTAGPEIYFSEYEDWEGSVKRGLKHLRGRVLNVGCGAGRHALYAQDQGHDVTGIDISPGALEVCRDRGVEDVRDCDVADVAETFAPDTFETVLMLGRNFGLVGTADRAPEILDRLVTVTTDDGQVIAETADPRATDDPYHRMYHDYNEDRGRLPGALRMRSRYKTHATDWLDYLMAAPETMDDLLAETVWTRSETWTGDNGQYVALLEKQ